MSEWPYEPIDTHVDDALGRFTSQYDDMTLMRGVSRVWAERMQALEDDAYDLLTSRWVDVAVGEQLDRIGEMVGEFRLARNDTDYRAAILIRIGLNRGSGEPGNVIFVMNQLLTTGEYAEDYPAGILITVTNEAVTLQQQRGIVSVTPAGVRVRGVSVLNKGGPVYGLAQIISVTTRIDPYVTELLEQQMTLNRSVATGSSAIAGVYPVLPDTLQQQNLRINRAIAHGGSSIITIAPYGVYLSTLQTGDGITLAYSDGETIYAYVS